MIAAARESAMRKLMSGSAAAVCSTVSALCMAQEVSTTALRTASGERVVRVATTLRQSPETVWKAFATEAGLRRWAAPVVKLIHAPAVR